MQVICRRGYNKQAYLITLYPILASLVLTYILSSGLYDYMDVLAILSIYTYSTYFLIKALILLKTGGGTATEFKLPSFPIDVKSFSNYIYKLLLFSVLSTETSLLIGIAIKDFVYSTLISIAATLLAIVFLDKLKTVLYRNIVATAIVVIAVALYVIGFVNDKLYDLDSWIRFFEAMLHGL
ncbi:MAG: hypothetical protein QW632_02240 [Ignisphaera sp.]